MKITPIIRCFMPSKLRSAYVWLVEVAMPFLLGPSIKNITVISIDNEDALKKSILQSQSFDSPFLRLDTWHILSKPLMKIKFLNCNDSLVLRIKEFLYSWLCKIESKSEYLISRNRFDSFIEQNRQALGDSYYEILDIVSSICGDSSHTLNYNFLYSVSFDFRGDTIVESFNSVLKNYLHSNMTLSNNARAQLLLSKEKAERTITQRGQALYRHPLWSISDTASYLTTYAEGILAHRRLRSQDYYVRRVSFNCWYVLIKSYNISESHSPIDERNSTNEEGDVSYGTSILYHEPVSFLRVRKVTVDRLQCMESDTRYITCTCGGAQRWLLPCRHIIAVMTAADICVSLSNIHIRWWKVYGYNLHADEDTSSTMAQHLVDCERFYSSFFCKQLKSWVGCPLTKDQIFSTELFSFELMEDDEIRHDMRVILNIAVLEGACVKISTLFSHDGRTLSMDEERHEGHNLIENKQQCNDNGNEQVNGVVFSHRSQCLSHIHNTLDISKPNKLIGELRVKETLNNMVHELVPVITDSEQLLAFQDLVYSFKQRQLNIKIAEEPDSRKPDAYFINATKSTSTKRQRRFKSNYEKIKKRKKNNKPKLANTSNLKDSTRNHMFQPTAKDEGSLQVYDALYGNGKDDEVVASHESKETGFIDTVQRQSLRRLKPGQWLNDEVIHFFFLLLAQRDAKSSPKKRCHFFKSFFINKLLDEDVSNTYQYRNVSDWSKHAPGSNLFDLDKIFFPVNIKKVHWALIVVFINEKRIQFYDSLKEVFCLDAILNYLNDEWKRLHEGEELPNLKDWKIVTSTTGIPKQENGFDCGVFTCMFADYIHQNKALDFTQTDVTQYRERIASSILRGDLLL